jgi:hypothetical protein
MAAFEICAALALLAVAAFQVWLTMRVMRSGLYERKQKMLQVELIWLIAIIGAALVFSVLREDDRAERGPPPELRS